MVDFSVCLKTEAQGGEPMITVQASEKEVAREKKPQEVPREHPKASQRTLRTTRGHR